jgi:hypothetical protein
VVSPDGEIEWPCLSRISDSEMKRLMQQVVNHCYAWVVLLLDENSRKELIRRMTVRNPCPRWDDPELPEHAELFGGILLW